MRKDIYIGICSQIPYQLPKRNGSFSYKPGRPPLNQEIKVNQHHTVSIGSKVKQVLKVKVKVAQSGPTLYDPYSPRNSPGQNTGVGILSLLQGIFQTQGSNPGLPHCRQILYQLSHKGSPKQVLMNRKKKRMRDTESFNEDEKWMNDTLIFP